MHYWVLDPRVRYDYYLVSTVTFGHSSCSPIKPLQVNLQGQLVATCRKEICYTILGTNKLVDSGKLSDLAIVYADILLRCRDLIKTADQ